MGRDDRYVGLDDFLEQQLAQPTPDVVQERAERARNAQERFAAVRGRPRGVAVSSALAEASALRTSHAEAAQGSTEDAAALALAEQRRARNRQRAQEAQARIAAEEDRLTLRRKEAEQREKLRRERRALARATSPETAILDGRVIDEIYIFMRRSAAFGLLLTTFIGTVFSAYGGFTAFLERYPIVTLAGARSGAFSWEALIGALADPRTLVALAGQGGITLFQFAHRHQRVHFSYMALVGGAAVAAWVVWGHLALPFITLALLLLLVMAYRRQPERVGYLISIGASALATYLGFRDAVIPFGETVITLLFWFIPPFLALVLANILWCVVAIASDFYPERTFIRG